MTDSTKWKTGASTCLTPGVTRTLYEEYAKAEVTAIEISQLPDRFDEINWPEVKCWSRETGVENWSVHLPYSRQLDISSKEREWREKVMQLYTEVLKKAADAGFRVAVIHPSSEPITDVEREERIKYSCDNLARLTDMCKSFGLTAAVEDLGRTSLGNCGDEIKRLVQCHEGLRVCFDVNHLLYDSHRHFMECVGEKIATVHISDYDITKERHWLPGQGMIDWKELIELLEGADYSGPFMYEIRRTAEPTAFSLEELRENHMQIARRLPITVPRNVYPMQQKEYA